MFRARLAALVVSGGMLLSLSGCMQWGGCGSGLFSSWSPFSRPVTVAGDDCACNSNYVGSTSMAMPAETVLPAQPQVYSIPPSTSPPPRLAPGATQYPYNPMQ